VIKTGNGTGKFMLRTRLITSRQLRVCFFGFAAVTAAVTFTTDIAQARRYRHHAHHHRSDSEDSYSPAFSEIIVDANSGAVLSSNNPDGSRHPASLTKIMTLYLLFERLESGKITLDTEMPVSEHASEQAPTKLGLRPGQTIRVEDAIKGLVTRSANDAAVVIAEAIGGDEDDFAKLMTRKARMLGMSRTTYHNASGLPDDEQVTTARDQSTLGRAIQDRFPRYYRYFSTQSFTYRGHSIANHNHLLGSVEGVDGIKTGYTRSSGFNLVTSIRRGNRHLVGVVMGGRSASSRDATMRSLLAENLEKASGRRTVAAITERNPASDTNAELADDAAPTQAPPASQAPSAPVAIAPASPRPAAVASLMSQARADASSMIRPEAKTEQTKTEPAPLTNGVIQTQPIAAIPGSSEPMKPVRVKTVQIKAGQVKLAAAGPAQSAPPVTSTIPARTDIPETSNAVVSMAESNKADNAKTDSARADLIAQPPGHGTGNGILGVLPASSLPSSSPARALAYAAPASPPQPVAAPTPSPAKPEIVHTGWIIQVGALDSESEALQRIEAARNRAHGLLNKADPFTETVVAKGDKKLVRARFAGLDRDQAEAVCKALKHTEISCMTIHN
jgi:D-alanyl-D-alanine carboxypeptidase